MGKPMKRVCTAALILAVGAAVAVSPAAEAETMLIVPGAEYALCDLVPAIPLVSRYYTRSIDIGRGFYPTSTPVVVNYPASIFAKGTIAITSRPEPQSSTPRSKPNRARPSSRAIQKGRSSSMPNRPGFKPTPTRLPPIN